MSQTQVNKKDNSPTKQKHAPLFLLSGLCAPSVSGRLRLRSSFWDSRYTHSDVHVQGGSLQPAAPRQVPRRTLFGQRHQAPLMGFMTLAPTRFPFSAPPMENVLKHVLKEDTPDCTSSLPRVQALFAASSTFCCASWAPVKWSGACCCGRCRLSSFSLSGL